jgi:demethylmenaquinone methyltransferase/2-methoxy-6-polyprenyl-1,4-benzoquinol methylase
LVPEKQMPEDSARLVRQMNAYYESRAPLHDVYMGYRDVKKTEALLAPIIRWVESYVAGRDIIEIACGTGNWTQVLSGRAAHVTATDASPASIELARAKPYPACNVDFAVADAYDLDLPGTLFEAAFMSDFWSHIPKGLIPRFLRSLKARLRPDSKVAVVDMLPTKNLTLLGSRHDADGNLIHLRKLPGGREYEVVRNFPEESELRAAVASVAEDVDYSVHEGLRRWMLGFTMK